MRAVALLLSLTLSLPAAGCFPTNARHRTYAKLGEGAALASGIGILLFTRTGADCAPTPGKPYADCREEASTVSAIGLGLILAGLIGFVATISTTPDDKPATPVAAPRPPAPPAPPPSAPAPAVTPAPPPAPPPPAPAPPAPPAPPPSPAS